MNGRRREVFGDGLSNEPDDRCFKRCPKTPHLPNISGDSLYFWQPNKKYRTLLDHNALLIVHLGGLWVINPLCMKMLFLFFSQLWGVLLPRLLPASSRVMVDAARPMERIY
jgi:hypothetical protein